MAWLVNGDGNGRGKNSMNRMKEIREASEDFLKEMVSKRTDRAGCSFEKAQRAWTGMFWEKMQELLNRREEGEQNLVISYLNSSIVTRSNAYRIALYDSELYVDPFPPCVYYTPEFLFTGMEEDEEHIRKFLKSRFIRLTDPETEEIRRCYVKQVYHEARPFFAGLIKGHNEYNIDVWFGEYMKNADYTGRI